MTKRRQFIVCGSAAIGLAALSPAVRALVPTPRQTAGPFYPETLPLDDDNDLVQVAGRSRSATGRVTDLQGRILDESGRPAASTVVEIWQCDANGRYHHPGDDRRVPLDENFQGYGRFETGRDGRYRFRTIRPAPYPGRTPHIHFRVTAPGFRSLTTQMYVADEPRNATDVLYKRLTAAARQHLTVPFLPHDGDDAEFAAKFDIVLTLISRSG